MKIIKSDEQLEIYEKALRLSYVSDIVYSQGKEKINFDTDYKKWLIDNGYVEKIT